MDDFEYFLDQKGITGVALPKNVLELLDEYVEERVAQAWQDGHDEGYDFGYEAAREDN